MDSDQLKVLTDLWTAQHVEVEIDVWPVEDGETVEHEDLRIGFWRFREKTFLELRLLLQRRENVVVVPPDATTVVVQDQDPLDREQGWSLKWTKLVLSVIFFEQRSCFLN